MNRGRHKKILILIAICLVAVFAEPDPLDELFYSRFSKNRDEDKCYDDNGRPQVRNFMYYIYINYYII